jgi:hypothetical protein
LVSPCGVAVPERIGTESVDACLTGGRCLSVGCMADLSGRRQH